MTDADVKVYQVLHCSEPIDTNPTTPDVPKQKYVVAEIVEVNQNEKLAKFKNLIITSKPFRLTFFEDQAESYRQVQIKDENGKSDAHIAGRIYTRKTRAYYVVDSKTGRPYKYLKGAMKGFDVVATSVKFFVHFDQEEEVEFDRVMRNNASYLVPTNELVPYIDLLGLDKEDLKAQGVDIDNITAKKQKDADILAGEQPTPPVVPPVTPPVQPPPVDPPTGG